MINKPNYIDENLFACIPQYAVIHKKKRPFGVPRLLPGSLGTEEPALLQRT